MRAQLKHTLRTTGLSSEVGVGIIYRNYRKALEGRLRNSVLI